ncbi:hypothetical protein [Richelia sinica]|uniref:hypothetical protein n=1 Tax=Richelia sinica TaxID=1357545 RepID=UPI001687FE47|nr:hypothetical protein [Richelia sinica]MBD2664649.1 hypothetical protein [Richelia sinica FACHB-800]
MKTKILVSGVLGLVGITCLTLPLIKFNPNSLPEAIASPIPQTLPPNLETAVRQKMAQQLEINPRLIKVTKSQRTTWQDCLPNNLGEIRSQPCKAVSRQGWSVTMSSPSENWVYYITNNGFITLDAPASLNKTILASLSKQLSLKPKQITIVAAQLTKGLPPCPINAACKVKPILGWRILVKNQEKPIFLGLNGQPLNYGNLISFLPRNVNTMSWDMGLKVLQDVVSRHHILTANLKVESIKSTKWNWCRSSGEGPTRPEMGICPDVEQTGWQMIVNSGANRYYYYIPTTAIPDQRFSPLPDGVQSLPTSIAAAIKKDAAKRAQVSLDQINLHQVEPKFFDNCLNIDNQKLHCRQFVQAGWQVQAIGGNVSSTNPTGVMASWTYHVNLTGNDIRFAKSGVYSPVP